MHPLANYIHSAPSDQNALDIFAGEWTSMLPEEYSHLRAGHLPLFADPRIYWAMHEFGGIVDKTILELGPLEGGHTYLLDRSGARQVVAIESNTNAFLRCLVLKDILQLTKSRYLCGDFAQYLRTTDAKYDACVSSGVLYHQLEPMRLLADIARVTSAVYIWTHYYDASLVSQNPNIRYKLGVPETKTEQGFTFSQVEFRYEKALEWKGFCGGTNSVCNWLTREAILGGLRHFGFNYFSLAYEEPEHENGPSFAIVARK